VKYMLLGSALLLAACSDHTSAPVVTYPEPGSPALANYQNQCSQCHAPPRPTAHTAVEWPSVIARMQQHRMERRMAPMLASKMTMVRDYLQRNAAKASQ